ncbi:MAG: beta-N-acetylglucosaminidase domain-containing protein [Sarcina sp.]
MKNIDYVIKDTYFNGEYLTFEKNKITLNFINRYSMIQELIEDFNSSYINIVKEDIADINYTYLCDLEIAEDGYRLEINKNGDISIFASCDRGFLYGQRVLEDLISFDDKKVLVPICIIEDEPDFRLRGIIEGFYGEPWSFTTRKLAVEFLNQNKMNTYMYAPKDDLYHRDKWREKYPKMIFNEIESLKKHCDKNFVDFYYCISPGKDIDVTNKFDIEVLCEKLNELIEIGVKDFALLLDDIDYSLKGKHSKMFRRIGQVHALLTNEVYNFLELKLLDFNLIMCPSEYWQNYETRYREDLKTYMYKDISVFWTGYNTIAKTITKKDCEIVSKNVERELILWDNVPVNDMDKKNIFLSAVTNRCREMNKFNHIGIVSNPMIQFHLSKLNLITFADFMWNARRYDEVRSLENACKKIAGEKSYFNLFNFCSFNKNLRIEKNLSTNLEEAIEKRDFKVLDLYYKDLSKSIENIEQIEDKKFLEELRPWIERAKFDIKFYKRLEYGTLENLEEFKEILRNNKYVIGEDILSKLIF